MLHRSCPWRGLFGAIYASVPTCGGGGGGGGACDRMRQDGTGSKKHGCLDPSRQQLAASNFLTSCAYSNQQTQECDADTTLLLLQSMAATQRYSSCAALTRPQLTLPLKPCCRPHLGLGRAHEVCFAVAKVADLQQRKRQALHHLQAAHRKASSMMSAAAYSTRKPLIDSGTRKPQW